jgi:hypothetical protein
MEIFTENVLYVIETLKSCKEFCDSATKLENLNEKIDMVLFQKVTSQINAAIKMCLDCNESNTYYQNTILYEIFTFLLSNYFEMSSLSYLNCEKLPMLSAELIIHLAIENELEDMEEVFQENVILFYNLNN